MSPRLLSPRIRSIAGDRIAQALTDGRLVGRRGSGRLRHLLIRHGGDPAVTYDLGGTKVLLPLSHQLPVTRRRYPYYAENLGHVARLVTEMRGTTMIDVGANVGDSAVIVKRHAPQIAILCVDAEATYLPYLLSNTARWPDVEIAAPVLLAEQTGPITGALVEHNGTARFDTSGSGSVAFSSTTLDDLLREQDRFAAPALLKSDTDGFEERVLRGAESTIASALPVLFLEYEPRLLRHADTDGLEMLGWLGSLGYQRLAIYDKFGRLMLRCDLTDVALLRDLHAYASSPGCVVDAFDLVVVAEQSLPILDRLAEVEGPIDLP
ncbi:MAG: FkbM family methyltransferase [Actinobacteria bacterium]|nr:FkbM family methyltransferase [Actinomycetota bacterium]